MSSSLDSPSHSPFPDNAMSDTSEGSNLEIVKAVELPEIKLSYKAPNHPRVTVGGSVTSRVSCSTHNFEDLSDLTFSSPAIKSARPYGGSKYRRKHKEMRRIGGFGKTISRKPVFRRYYKLSTVTSEHDLGTKLPELNQRLMAVTKHDSLKIKSFRDERMPKKIKENVIISQKQIKTPPEGFFFLFAYDIFVNPDLFLQIFPSLETTHPAPATIHGWRFELLKKPVSNVMAPLPTITKTDKSHYVEGVLHTIPNSLKTSITRLFGVPAHYRPELVTASVARRDKNTRELYSCRAITFLSQSRNIIDEQEKFYFISQCLLNSSMFLQKKLAGVITRENLLEYYEVCKEKLKKLEKSFFPLPLREQIFPILNCELLSEPYKEYIRLISGTPLPPGEEANTDEQLIPVDYVSLMNRFVDEIQTWRRVTKLKERNTGGNKRKDSKKETEFVSWLFLDS
ncbi:hypothetical protein PCE1_000426 [Barthelona sp. PCE]